MARLDVFESQSRAVKPWLLIKLYYRFRLQPCGTLITVEPTSVFVLCLYISRLGSISMLHAVSGTSEIIMHNTAQDVSYSIRRLVRGLASPRESSRLGFAVALTEVRSLIFYYRLALCYKPGCSLASVSIEYCDVFTNCVAYF